ncbi:hypothetical protein [Elizabethkingia ursingii]|jgi:hypothetical protein|uniref:Uncharacterized protein n=1 Tax=Elizabethkingia ursingii TaxID=1756150 RepID=A0AAJ3NEY2_9FLAO|nr:hypothetical protein [Elizabethkingia ursingii]MDR2228379.1 hypothetical protein [Flavobacteriaceae bacterium]AQX07645.1 hypothetical protein BBD34_02865 [Elizabethkingia ursingii]MCL1666004.1 hypothetical protein [Elizabethkingia ursingii]OPB79505.1 hypothetical protein BAY32_17570 [Elizabethkingia ursingii]OPC05026.1 hypothetical protein BAS09_04920 [Elizabethkingia ursingii]
MKKLLLLLIPVLYSAQNKTNSTKSDSSTSYKNIKEIVLSNRSNPRALAILAKANRNFKQNSPKNQDSYSFKAYSKFSVDFDKDSIANYQNYVARRIDSLKLLGDNPEFSKRKRKDSIEDISYKDMLTTSKMFLWERAMEYKYNKEQGEHIDILDNKVSGLKRPLYDAIALRSNIGQIPDEIQKENWTLYRYYLTDSILLNGRETYVIGFRKTNITFSRKRKYSGYIYIDKENYAVAKIEDHGKDKTDLEHISIWKPINNSWFLEKEYMKSRIGSIPFKNKDSKKRFNSYFYIENNYFDFKVPDNKLTPDDFKGYTYAIKNTTGTELPKYRKDNFDQRDNNTYYKMDSLFKAKKVEFKLNFLAGITRGDFRFGIIDFPIDRFFDINRYENFRFGLGMKLNENFNPYVSPDAYVGYGVRDGKWKFRVGVDVRTTLERDAVLRLDYTDDVGASGRFRQNLWVGKMKIMNTGAGLQTLNYYRYRGFKLSYLDSPINSFMYKVEAAKYKEEALFNYLYKGQDKIYDNFSTVVTLKYSPNSKYIMTPTGKDMVEQGYPELYFNWEKGWTDLKYNRLDLLALYQQESILGQTGLRVYGGYVGGDFPFWKTFEGGGLAPEGKKSFMSRFNLTTYLGFATMPSGKYYQDKFGAFYISHRIPWHFKSFGQNTSSFDLVYKGIIGDFKNPEFHQIKFETLNKLYQEVGVEWNNFLSTQFNLGFFYRVGHYQTSNFTDNFAIQLKLKILGF